MRAAPAQSFHEIHRPFYTLCRPGCAYRSESRHLAAQPDIAACGLLKMVLSRASFPGLHYNVERRDGNSTNRREKFSPENRIRPRSRKRRELVSSKPRMGNEGVA